MFGFQLGFLDETGDTRSWRSKLRFAAKPGIWPVLLGAVALVTVLAPAALAHVHCNRIAAPYGSDRYGNGSHRRPYRTLHRLDASLRPGQTGCLRAGTYGSFASHQRITKNGTWRHRITVRAYPGEHVKLVGWIQVTAARTTISDFEIDGSNRFATPVASSCSSRSISAGLSIEGVGDVFERNDYYQSVPGLRSNGIGIGWSGSGDETIIRHDRIHDVGGCMAFDHLIYLAHGRDVQIYDNWLWHDPHGWGVQVYPGPSGARIYNNVIYAAGSGFTVGGSSSTSDNRFYHNVVVGSTGLPAAGTVGVAISDSWDGTPGSFNFFVDNDSYRNRGGVAAVQAVYVSHNITANPKLADPAAHDFRTSSASPLSRWGLWDGGLGSFRSIRKRR